MHRSDLNHPKVQIVTPERAEEIGLSHGFQRFVFATERPEAFRYWVEDLPHTWTCFVPEVIDQAFALWSCNADQTLACLQGRNLSFWQGYHDDPGAKFIARSEQGLLCSLFVSLYEAEVPDEELIEAAGFASFRYLSELISWLEVPRAFSDFHPELERFIESIDVRAARGAF